MNAALLVIAAMNHSDIGFQAVWDAGLCSTLSELVNSEYSLPLEFAFKILFGCPTKLREPLLLGCGLADTMMSRLR